MHKEKNLFRVKNRWMDFNITSRRKFINMVSDSIKEVTFEKLHLLTVVIV